jgi:hypothetical protein
VGFYAYYFLCSGNWNYFFSGVWTHEGHEFESLFSPGFYIQGHSVPIPKILAVFLTFGIAIALATTLGFGLEKLCRWYWPKQGRHISPQRAQHLVFTGFTIASFWTFFSFGARPLINRMPISLVLAFNAILVIIGSIWLVRTMKRTPEQFERETMATSLRHQLKQIDRLNAPLLDGQSLDGRSIDELTPDEVYLLVKILPNFSQKLRFQAYSGVVLEILKQQEVSLLASFEFCQSLRRELKLQDADHFTVIEMLGQSEPEILSTAASSQPQFTQDDESATVAKTIVKTILKRVRG